MQNQEALQLDEPIAEPSPELQVGHYRNVAAAMLLFVARVAASVVQLRIVEKVWGGQYSGLNALSNQVLLYVTLLELGLAQAAISLLYGPIVARNTERVSSLVLAMRHDVRRLALIGAAVLPLALAGYAFVIHTSVEYVILVINLELVAVTGLIQLSALHYQAYLNAAGRIDRVNYVLGTGYLLKTTVGLSVAIATHNYLWLPLMTAALTLGEFAALRIAFRQNFPDFLKVSEWREAAKSIHRRARYVLVHRVGGLAYYQSDFIVLSLTTSLLVVKDYAKYQYVSAALLSMIGMIAIALTTSLAHQQIGHSAHIRRLQYERCQLATAALAFVFTFGYWFTAPIVVTIAFGAGVAIPWYSVALFGIALYLNMIKTVDDTFVAAQGAFEVGFWLPLIEAPVYIVLGVVLSLKYGFTGILVASIASNLLVPVFAKGLILAGPVFDCARAEWFMLRLKNTMYGLVLATPVLLFHLLAAALLPSKLAHFTIVNIISAGYAATVVKKTLATGFARSGLKG